ncbi:hypothetical protein WA026_005697 [Henosepilachna vigintioctopunctata]|uniref:Tubulin/FtsZ GTPase domain-containing protein n=1 Tax=Henosepilachna vigintioctopunctata TaxID=420089 RepID=A0AAW1TX62_9CUCU
MSFLSFCYGHCGNQIGDVLYSTIFEDIKNDNASLYFNNSLKKWFNVQRNGKWEARCILVDTENKVIATRKHKIYGFKNVVTGCYGSSENNWAYGYNCQSDLVLDSILNMVRKENEKRHITSYMNILSSGGGSGSGVGSKVIEELKNEYPKKNILNAVILPYLNGDLNTQNYNTILSLAKLHSATDSSVLFENDKLYYTCSTKLRNNINFNDLNKVIAFQLASIFQPLTSENDTFSINQLTTHNLFKYLQLKSSFPSTQYYKFESSQTWRNKLYPLIKQYEEFKGFKDTLQLKTKIMMSAVITRGKDKPTVKELEWFQSARNFVNWIPKDYQFSQSHESRHFCGREKTLTILTNDNNICNFLNSTIENAWKLFTKKAYLHHYEKHDVSIEEFQSSFQKMEDILAGYSNL